MRKGGAALKRGAYHDRCAAACGEENGVLLYREVMARTCAEIASDAVELIDDGSHH